MWKTCSTNAASTTARDRRDISYPKSRHKSVRDGRLGQVTSGKQVEASDDRGYGEQDRKDRLGGHGTR